MMVDSGAWDDEDELADAYQARKSFAYGRRWQGARSSRSCCKRR